MFSNVKKKSPIVSWVYIVKRNLHLGISTTEDLVNALSIQIAIIQKSLNSYNDAELRV